MAWTDEERESVIKQYKDAEPTAETSMEIVSEIANDIGQSANGVRMILTKAGVYIKKEAGKRKAKGTTRVSKQDSQDSLTAAITDAGQKANEDVIDKLTGKAAAYLTDVINAIVKNVEMVDETQ